MSTIEIDGDTDLQIDSILGLVEEKKTLPNDYPKEKQNDFLKFTNVHFRANF